MKTLSRYIAIVTVAFGVSALAMIPAIAIAAEKGSYSAIVPNNTAGANGARKAYDIWQAKHPHAAHTQGVTKQVSHEVVPNNDAGPNRGSKAYEIWQSKQAKMKKPNPNSPAMKTDFSQQGKTVLQQVHQARVALSNGNYNAAKKLIHDARATLSDMYNSGASGNIVISGQVIFDQDFSAGNQPSKAALVNQVILPFDETRGNVDLAYTEMINSHPFRANQTLRLVEQDLSVQTAHFSTSSTVTPANS